MSLPGQGEGKLIPPIVPPSTFNESVIGAAGAGAGAVSMVAWIETAESEVAGFGVALVMVMTGSHFAMLMNASFDSLPINVPFPAYAARIRGDGSAGNLTGGDAGDTIAHGGCAEQLSSASSVAQNDITNCCPTASPPT